jgi:hypothetical protein
MQIKENSYSIVLVGKWNNAILNPGWLVENLFEGNPEVKIEFSLNADMPSRYIIKNIIIAPSTDRVIFISNDNSDDSISLMESIAVKLCSILEHTPLVAVGVNFAYIEKVNKDKLLPLLNFSDNDSYSDNNWNISNQSIKRNLIKDHYNVNVSIAINKESDFELTFNYHYPATNVANIKECLVGKAIDYKNKAIELAKIIYEIELEVEQ